MNNKISSPNFPEQVFNELPLDDQLVFKFNIAFSSCLNKRRKELGWTQAVLAEKSGVNRVTIAKLERFQRTASIEVVLKLLYALGMDLKFIDTEQTD